MADTKLSDLTADTAPDGADLLYTVKAGGGDRKVTLDDLAASDAFTSAATTAGTHISRTGGDLTLNSASWANVDTGADLTIAASTGDLLLASLSAFLSNENVTVSLDVVTVVAGTVTHTFNGSAEGSSSGNPGWLTTVASFVPVTGSSFYTVAADDITAGQVTLRLRYKVNTASRTMRRNAALPLKFAVIRISV